MIKTPRGIIRNARYDAAHFIAFTPYQSVPTWFQGLLTSRKGYFSAFAHATWSTIGLESYLGLEVSASHIPARYPTHGTLGTSHGHVHYAYGTFTLYGAPFQDDFYFTNLGNKCPYSTSLQGFPRRFGLSYSVFIRHYSRNFY